MYCSFLDEINSRWSLKTLSGRAISAEYAHLFCCCVMTRWCTFKLLETSFLTRVINNYTSYTLDKCLFSGLCSTFCQHLSAA